VSPELLKVFGPATCLPAQVIEEAAEWLVDKILHHFGMQAAQAEGQTRRIGDFGNQPSASPLGMLRTNHEVREQNCPPS